MFKVTPQKETAREPEHEYCEHNICRKCQPCGACEGKEAGKRAVAELLKEFERKAVRA